MDSEVSCTSKFLISTTSPGNNDSVYGGNKKEFIAMKDLTTWDGSLSIALPRVQFPISGLYSTKYHNNETKAVPLIGENPYGRKVYEPPKICLT